jgi:hypothetical protein
MPAPLLSMCNGGAPPAAVAAFWRCLRRIAGVAIKRLKIMNVSSHSPGGNEAEL